METFQISPQKSVWQANQIMQKGHKGNLVLGVMF